MFRSNFETFKDMMNQKFLLNLHMYVNVIKTNFKAFHSIRAKLIVLYPKEYPELSYKLSNWR